MTDSKKFGGTEIQFPIAHNRNEYDIRVKKRERRERGARGERERDRVRN